MGSAFAWVIVFILLVVAATVGSTKLITEGNEALVERLGRYHRKLTPGLNYLIIPFVDRVVVQASVKEQILDINPREDISEATTVDNVRVTVDAVVFWRIFELEKAWYAIEDVEEGIKNLVITTLRSEVGQMTLQETNSGRDRIIRALLEALDEATEPWGVKITRVEIQDIKPPDSVIQALERERAAESEKRAAIAEAEGRRQAAVQEAEGRKQATIREAEAISESVKRIAEVLPPGANPQDILKYLVAQRYVEANYRLGESDNSKIVFMNPRDLTESLSELIEPDLRPRRINPGPSSGNSSSRESS
ncbi:SPFH domain-containing protein [Thermocoleostomius sinensis]|jgi:regulator of protease activity HflC (stomatin/prohibitin superfamily)|uniref:SPFH/Band 7/PHB domain protein n=1 Tax=Thermocoleostomius sinensis A174 TaxID=2016057 RepID=A0A9E9C8E9_9CYAN|nr:SPFH domain-containing protein [Thermocoleostomius sinensis]WAL58367.1 SPFH/Band 7/PHB domain protein [Thermocoleostomius sinensis A174]